MRAFGKTSGASHLMVPEAIVKVEVIPLLGSGKVDYTTARRLALESLGIDKAA